MATIILDPGHGGHDPGAVNGMRYEKNDNLRLGLAVRDRITAQGYCVIMTRSTDTFIPLDERSAISNRNHGSIFVSLHRNAFSNANANGVETLVHPDAPASTRRHAQHVQNALVGVGVQSDRGVRTANFAVLRNTRAPAMMIELGFISNARDNQMFDDKFSAYVEAISRSILETIGLPYRPPCPYPPHPHPPHPHPEPHICDRAIAAIQGTLNRWYNTRLAIDGQFGPQTKRGLVIGLQTELNATFNAGLVVDGIFGPRTRAAIRRGLRRGDRGNMVYILQAALYSHGFYLDADSSFGPITDRTVRDFQRSRGLVVDGIAGPATFTALLG